MDTVSDMKECMLEFMGHLTLQETQCLNVMVLSGRFNIVKRNGKIGNVEDQNI